uniref:F-box domain-containing protein n=1 Tax=Globodera pallida TaxID=36090 RepID=A0A183C293_GLOPA
MSDNKNESEQQQQMEEIFICADVWYGVFPFLGPLELGLKMALISDRLDVLVDVHFKSRKWSLGSLEIRCVTDRNGAQIFNKCSDEQLPIPQGPLPNKVIGFGEIQISYVDKTVIEFLQRICQLFDSSGANVTLDIGHPFNYAFDTSDYQSRSWKILRQEIWPLLNDNICGLHLHFYQLERLRQFSPAVLRNCAKLRSIDFVGLFPELPAEDNAGASAAQAVAKWLLTPRGDGLPKSFVNALEPVNFIIRLGSSFADLLPFELKNNWTGEQLTLRRFNKDKWLLVRCPIGREEDKWEEEAIEWEMGRQWNRIAINFEDRDIGKGMVDPTPVNPLRYAINPFHNAVPMRGKIPALKWRSARVAGAEMAIWQ